MELKEYRFDEITVNFDKKRVPLSGAQREKRQGKYRYYGAVSYTHLTLPTT